MNKGLTVVLDAHTNMLGSSTIDVDNQGFIGTVTSSASFPLTFQDGFQIIPGHTTMVSKVPFSPSYYSAAKNQLAVL